MKAFFMLMIFSFSVYANFCTDNLDLDSEEKVKKLLKRSLLKYLSNPDAAKNVKKEDLKDMIQFYMAETGGVDCGSAVGAETNEPLGLTFEKAEKESKDNDIPVLKCTDGTEYGECATRKPLFCYAGKLVKMCAGPDKNLSTEDDNCGCPEGGEDCIPSTNTCGPERCSDGTVYGECTGIKPKSCGNGVIVDKCSSCGCPEGYECNAETEACQTSFPTCSDGTVRGFCSQVDQGKNCTGTSLIDSCSTCGCKEGFVCNSTTQACYLRTCLDGTLDGQCSQVHKSWYCTGYELFYDCLRCGCIAGYECMNSSCRDMGCHDGSDYGGCSVMYPGKKCFRQMMYDNCTSCGCHVGQECMDDSCVDMGCTDGTSYGECSIMNRGRSCFRQILYDNCTTCGCLDGQACNPGTGICIGMPDVCPDGTSDGQCSSIEVGKMCHGTDLFNNCTICGCSSGQICNPLTRACVNSTCWDGTLNGSCSSVYPGKTCSYGGFIDDCGDCGCHYSQWCNLTRCADYPGCSDGTSSGQCSSVSIGKFCLNMTLFNECSTCGCNQTTSCNSTTGICRPATSSYCIDGTHEDSCSLANVGKYCDSNVLTDRCDYCSCDSGMVCNLTSRKCYAPSGGLACIDGTNSSDCSVMNYGFMCLNGDLIADCDSCGCIPSYGCDYGSNYCVPEDCPDGTPLWECSTINEGYFCDYGSTLVSNCTYCNCTLGGSCAGNGYCI